MTHSKLTFSNRIKPEDSIYFMFKWKGYTHQGSVPLAISELSREDMAWLEYSIREDVQQQIIEDCLDEYFDSEKREKAEHRLTRNLLESGKVKWYDMKTDKLIKPKGEFMGKWCCMYSDFVGNIEFEK